MKNLFKKAVVRRHNLTMEEKDVLKVVTIINNMWSSHYRADMLVVEDDIIDNKGGWLVSFRTSDERWEEIKLAIQKDKNLGTVRHEEKMVVETPIN